MLRTDIGEGEDALLCTTDRADCCSVVRAGEFYFPNGTQVPVAADVIIRSYYRNRGDGFIRLNHRPNSGVATGRFRCEIPDADEALVILFVNIGVYI